MSITGTKPSASFGVTAFSLCRRILPPSQRLATGRRPSLVPELKQSPRIGAADLDAVVFADGAGVEPVGGVVDVFERPVGREHDAVGADFQHGVDQRLGAEIGADRIMF